MGRGGERRLSDLEGGVILDRLLQEVIDDHSESLPAGDMLWSDRDILQGLFSLEALS
jgi:hypothetical protein